MCFCYLALINKNNDFQLQTQNHITFSFKALVSIFFCRIFEAFDFEISHMRTLITGFQTGGKICSNLGPQRQSADPSITHGPSLSCPEYSSVGRRLNWTWPQHFPTQRQCPTLRSWRHYQLMPRSSAGGPWKVLARRPRSARRDSFASLHAKGRKRKTINSPWEHAEDMNLPGSADCQRSHREPAPSFLCPLGLFRFHFWKGRAVVGGRGAGHGKAPWWAIQRMSVLGDSNLEVCVT